MALALARNTPRIAMLMRLLLVSLALVSKLLSGCWENEAWSLRHVQTRAAYNNKYCDETTEPCSMCKALAVNNVNNTNDNNTRTTNNTKYIHIYIYIYTHIVYMYI